jgi:hypothetical protein
MHDARETEESDADIEEIDNPSEQAKRACNEEVLREIQYLKNNFGPSLGEDALPIPYTEAERLFQIIETWTRQASQTEAINACERVEKAAKTIEEAVAKLQSAQPISYAQAARRGGAQATEFTLETTPRVHPKEEKGVIIKIADKEEAREIKEQSRKEIASRIQQAAGGTKANHTVLAVRQLKSGDRLSRVRCRSHRLAIFAGR